MKSILRVFGCMVIMLAITTGYLFGAEKSTMNDKTNKPGWIGIMIQDVTEKIAKKTKLDSNDGAYVKEVVEDSPADSAGIREGDVIVEFNGKRIFDSDDLSKAVRCTVPKTKTNLIVVRDGIKKTFQLTVGKAKRMRHQNFGVFPSIPDINISTRHSILGLQLITLNEQLGEYFGAPNNEGVLVEEVEKESAADKAGFKAGDIITRIGNKSVADIERIQKELQKYDEGDKAEFELLRKGTAKKLTVEIEEEQNFHRNFQFHKPNMRMFRFEPSDEAEMNLYFEKMQPELNRLKIDIEKAVGEIDCGNQEIRERIQPCLPKILREARL